MTTLRMIVELLRRDELLRRESRTRPSRSAAPSAPSSYKNKKDASEAVVAALAGARRELVAQVSRLLPPEPPRRVQFEADAKKNDAA